MMMPEVAAATLRKYPCACEVCVEDEVKRMMKFIMRHPEVVFSKPPGGHGHRAEYVDSYGKPQKVEEFWLGHLMDHLEDVFE